MSRKRSQLSGRSVLITGAASGIGQRISHRFAAEGVRVAAADRDAEGARAVAEAIGREGGDAIPIVMDVSSETDVDRGVAEASATFGGIDILISNAGVQHIAPLVDLAFDDWRRVLAVHLDGAFLTTRACMRLMQRNGRGGTILYTGSVHSVEASPLKAPYIAAKHALIGLARLVAKEGAPHGIRANVLCPGFVRTPLVEKQIPEQAQTLNLTEDEVVRNVMLRNTVDGEFTSMDDVADAALFFCAFPSLALTGQSLLISHGWHMQ